MAYGKEIKEIAERLATITAIPGHKDVTKKEYTYNVDGDITSIKFYSETELLLTLTYSYDASKNLVKVERSYP